MDQQQQQQQQQQLHTLLQQSFSPDAAIRKPAEQQIRNLKHVPGAVGLLLAVVRETQQVRVEVRQAAAIQLKNICRESWAARTHPVLYNYPPSGAGDAHQPQQPQPQALLSDADKNAAKEQLIAILLAEPEKSMRGLLTEALQTMVIHDFPEKWPTLVPQLLQTVAEGAPVVVQQQQQLPVVLAVHNALFALRKVCKRYEYKPVEAREPLHEIIRHAFPLLLPLAQELIKMAAAATTVINPLQDTTTQILKQILKIFWSCTQFFLPPTDANNTEPLSLARPEQLQPWFDVLTAALSLAAPPTAPQPSSHNNNHSDDEQQRNAWPVWKVKKWAVQIMSRWFSRYGMASADDDDAAAVAFANHFATKVAPQFLGPIFDTLNLRPTGQFCTDRVVHLCLTFAGLAVELSSTYKMLKPHLEFLLFSVCFPTLCLSAADVECFETDPYEFVHKQNSPLADFYDPRLSAVTLITDLVRHRGQDVTQPLLGRMTNILHRYHASGAATNDPVEAPSHIEKDGALLTFGSLSKLLMAKPKYENEIHGLLITSVFPDFASRVAFLRYRACWMVQQFTVTLDGAHLSALLQHVLQRLNDPALPVQIEASKALRCWAEVDGSETVLLPILPQILTEYFRIMDEIGNEEVVSALQVLLDRFGDHLQPHAVQLVTQLTRTFQQYCTDDEDDDDAALAAAQCLECVATVLKGICAQPAMMRALEPLLMPLVLSILGNDGDFLEYLECALDILTFLTIFQDELSAEVWTAFPLIYNAFDQWAYDYLNMMVPCLLAYIQKGPEVFLAGQTSLNVNGAGGGEAQVPYMDLVVSMASKTIANETANEVECRYAMSLFMGVLHNCPGRINAYFPYINEIVLGKLGQQVNEKVPLTRVSIYQVLGSALYYDPKLELEELEKRGVTTQVFGKWLADLEKMRKGLAQKLTVMGFTAVFTLPTQQLPATLVCVLPQLLHAAVKVALQLHHEKQNPQNTDAANDAAAALEALNEAEQKQHQEELGDVDKGFGEDEDVRNDADEAYRRAFHQRGEWTDDMAKFFLGDMFEENGEDVDEDYNSPIDQVDELVALNDTLKLAFQREPEPYQQVQSALPPGAVADCQNLFAIADAMRAAAAQQAAAQS